MHCKEQLTQEQWRRCCQCPWNRVLCHLQNGAYQICCQAPLGALIRRCAQLKGLGIITLLQSLPWGVQWGFGLLGTVFWWGKDAHGHNKLLLVAITEAKIAEHLTLVQHCQKAPLPSPMQQNSRLPTLPKNGTITPLGPYFRGPLHVVTLQK